MFLAPSGTGNIAGYIKLRSLKSLDKKPEIFSIGGFTVENKNKEKIHFDFNWSSGNAEIDENGLTIFDVELLDFDEELLEGKTLKAKDIITGELIEIFYECYYNEVDEENGDLIPLEVINFNFEEDNIEYAFTNEQLKIYNEKYDI